MSHFDNPNIRKVVPSAALAGNKLRATSTKKQIEQAIVSTLFDRLGISTSKIVMGEKPDVCVSLSIGTTTLKIGCEVTQFHISQVTPGGSPGEAFVNQWIHFAKSLETLLRDPANTKLANIYGAIHFRRADFQSLNRIDRRNLINEIVHLLKHSQSVEVLKDFDHVLYPQLAAHVDHIWTAEFESSGRPLWWCAHLQSGLIEDPTDRFRKIIEAKSIPALKYLWEDIAPNRRWLVIGGRGRGTFDVQPAFVPRKGSKFAKSRCPFSHVFFIDLRSQHLVQLYPKACVISPNDDVIGMDKGLIGVTKRARD